MPLLKVTNYNAAAESDDGSCKYDEVEEGEEVALHFVPKWGTEDFAYDEIYTVGGVDVKFSDIRFYLSNFEFESMSSSTEVSEDENEEIEDKVILVDAQGEEHHSIANTELDHLHKISFLLGLDSVTNHQESPDLASPPLNDASMHWGWNPAAGYKFIRIEGSLDSLGTGVYKDFAIHCATDALKREVSIDVMKDIDDAMLMLMMHVNYEKVFEGVDFNNLGATHGNTELTNKIADQLVNSITLK